VWVQLRSGLGTVDHAGKQHRWAIAFPFLVSQGYGFFAAMERCFYDLVFSCWVLCCQEAEVVMF
jgi:hypothetical protein